ncbi:unnamed protein product [Rotaria sp. Silwood1]|nr:unnamed protein product [Rotaria sp. Silwood1]CAF3707821.1 unnamed protein product [Rotaria sp. Silwood1]CAF3712221.1 unnamed protein product [Rotaria sp. Silwood1]CAF4885503.1 unnamed protein product [Rotaria sp. Silwood1]
MNHPYLQASSRKFINYFKHFDHSDKDHISAHIADINNLCFFLEIPEIGSCTDITCDNTIKELYECHCCLLVCLNHLTEHVEITKQNKRRLDSVHSQLNIVITTLTLIVEKKLLTIGREQNLIEQAKRFLDALNSSIDEIQNIFEQVNQAIMSDRSEMMVKIEPPSSSEIKDCSCACKYQSPLRNTRSKSKSLICLDAAIDTGIQL